MRLSDLPAITIQTSDGRTHTFEKASKEDVEKLLAYVNNPDPTKYEPFVQMDNTSEKLEEVVKVYLRREMIETIMVREARLSNATKGVSNE